MSVRPRADERRLRPVRRPLRQRRTAAALGGRAEIQDAAIVGDQSGSVGTLTIDGVDSLLQSGGFETTSTNPDEVHYMIVGRLGSGTMRSPTAASRTTAVPSPRPAGNDEIFGAVIGSNLAADN